MAKELDWEALDLLKPLYKDRIGKWIYALASGDYSQGRRGLKNNGAYCCLGLACELSRLSEWDNQTIDGFDKYLAETGVMPPEVRNYYGVLDPNGVVESGITLSSLNDNGTSFKGIAKVILEQIRNRGSLFNHYIYL